MKQHDQHKTLMANPYALRLMHNIMQRIDKGELKGYTVLPNGAIKLIYKDKPKPNQLKASCTKWDGLAKRGHVCHGYKREGLLGVN